MSYDDKGRRVLHGHPSTWRQECEELRRDYGLMQIDRNNLRSLLDATEAKVDELHDKLDDAQAEAKALRSRVQELEAENERLRAFVSMYDDLREGIRELGVKRKPQIYPTILAMDAARAGLRTNAFQKQEGGK